MKYYYNPKTMTEVYENGEPTIDEVINSCTDSWDETDWKQDFIDSCCAHLEADKDDFLWLTHKGEFIYVSAMQTDHLFNAFRMTYNHSVPAAFRVGDFNRRNDVFRWSPEYRQGALEAMGNELEGRILNQQQRDELRDIEGNEEALRILIQADKDQVASVPSSGAKQPTFCY